MVGKIILTSKEISIYVECLYDQINKMKKIKINGKLSPNEWLNLCASLRNQMYIVGPERTAEQIEKILNLNFKDIDKSFEFILEEYGINLENLDLKWDSLCEWGQIPPLYVALQIFFSSLHPKLKPKDLDLEEIKKESNSKEIVNKIIIQWLKQLWIYTKIKGFIKTKKNLDRKKKYD